MGGADALAILLKEKQLFQNGCVGPLIGVGAQSVERLFLILLPPARDSQRRSASTPLSTILSADIICVESRAGRHPTLMGLIYGVLLRRSRKGTHPSIALLAPPLLWRLLAG